MIKLGVGVTIITIVPTLLLCFLVGAEPIEAMSGMRLLVFFSYLCFMLVAIWTMILVMESDKRREKIRRREARLQQMGDNPVEE